MGKYIGFVIWFQSIEKRRFHLWIICLPIKGKINENTRIPLDCTRILGIAAITNENKLYWYTKIRKELQALVVYWLDGSYLFIYPKLNKLKMILSQIGGSLLSILKKTKSFISKKKLKFNKKIINLNDYILHSIVLRLNKTTPTHKAFWLVRAVKESTQ